MFVCQLSQWNFSGSEATCLFIILFKRHLTLVLIIEFNQYTTLLRLIYKWPCDFATDSHIQFQL